MAQKSWGMSILKWLGILLGSLLLLLGGLLAVLDWNLARGYLAQKISQRIGRAVTINGTVAIDWSLTPLLRATDIRLENASWSHEPFMFECELLELRLNLFGLLRGRIDIPQLLLKKPRGILEISPQGQPNWNFAATSDEAQKKPAKLPIIEHLWIDDGYVIYRDLFKNTDIVASISTIIEQNGKEFLKFSAQGKLVGGDVHLQAQLAADNDVWRIEALHASLGESDLTGQGTMNLHDQQPLLQATLASSTIHIVQLQAILRSASPSPINKKDAASLTLDVAPLRALDADIFWEGSKLLLPHGTLRNVTLHLQLQRGRLQIAPLQVPMGEGTAQLRAMLDASTDAVQGSLQVHLDHAGLQSGLTAFGIERATMATLDGVLRLSLSPPDNPLSLPTAPTLLQRLQIEESELHYRDIAADMEVDATLHTVPNNDVAIMQLVGQGHIQHQKMTFHVEADALGRLEADSEAPFQSKAEATLGDSQARLQLRLAASATELTAALSGANTTDLRPLLGANFPGLANYQLQGNFQRTADGWQASQVTASADGLAVHGEMNFKTSAERPFMKADVYIDDLQMQSLLDSEAAHAPTTTTDSTQKTSPSFYIAPLQALDAEVTIRSRHLSAANLSFDEMTLQAQLHQGQLQIKPLSLQWPGGKITAEINIDARERLLNGSLHSTIKRLDLHQLLQLFTADAPPLGIVGGQLNLRIVDIDSTNPGSTGMLALFENLIIAKSQLTYRDKTHHIDVQASIDTAKAGAAMIVIDAQGQYQERPFTLEARGEPLFQLLAVDRAYTLAVKAQTEQTDVSLRGRLKQPLTLQGLDMHLAIAGPDPKLLSPLLGVPLPSLPPYKVQGKLVRQGSTWTFADFGGRVGDSDLSGTIHVETKDTLPFIKAALTSRLLDFDDLGPLIGVAPDATAGETASPKQQREEAVQQASRTVLPHKSINFDNLRRVNASIKFRGQHMKSSLPLDDLTASIQIQAGHLTIAPLDFGVASGHVTSRLEVDARSKPAKTSIEAEIKHIRLKEIVAHSKIASDSFGIIGGQVKVWVQGNSVAEMLASLDGGILLLMSGGKFDSLLVEIAGLDIGETFATLLGRKKNFTIHCAFVDMHAVQGIAQLKTFVVDTDDTLFLGGGSIDFLHEALDVVIDPKPKDLSLLSARAPLHITGNFVKPRVRPGALAILRGAASLALLPAAPIAVLIPLLDTNTPEENIPKSTYCSGFVDAIKKARQ